MYLCLSSRPSAFLRYPWAPQGSSETCQWAASPKVSNICFIHEQFSDLNTAKAFNRCLQYSAFEGLLQFFVVRLGFSWGKVLPTLQEILDSELYRKRTERCALLLCFTVVLTPDPTERVWWQLSSRTCRVLWKPYTIWFWSILASKKNPNSAPGISGEPWESRRKGLSALSISD